MHVSKGTAHCGYWETPADTAPWSPYGHCARSKEALEGLKAQFNFLPIFSCQFCPQVIGQDYSYGAPTTRERGSEMLTILEKERNGNSSWGRTGVLCLDERRVYISVCLCVHAYTYTIINRKLFFGSNQFEAGRTKFPYYK